MISNVYFETESMVISINDQNYRFKLNEISVKLANADEQDRKNFVISPSGYGIHWPSIDEDLSINGLLKKGQVA